MTFEKFVRRWAGLLLGANGLVLGYDFIVGTKPNEISLLFGAAATISTAHHFWKNAPHCPNPPDKIKPKGIDPTV